MRKINIADCEVGMILGKAVYHKGFAILLEAGAKLTLSYIHKLNRLGVTEIYINDDISQGIVIQDVVREQTRVEAIEAVREIMKCYRSDHVPFFSREIIEIVDNILSEILSLDDIIINLMDIKTCDGYTFSHSVNVCILSIITGIKLNMVYDDLHELGIGAILHDIGKVMVPREILLKNAELTDTEYEEIKQHARIGYNILKEIPGISEAAALVALNHHERYDGKGYPHGLKNEEIHIYSRIVAIADIYDALTSDRVYRKKISTYMAIEYLTVMAAPSLDSKVLRFFTEIIPQYPLGTVIILNTGEKAVVMRPNRELPSRPFIRIVFSSDGTRRPVFDEIDLATRNDYFIVSTER